MTEICRVRTLLRFLVNITQLRKQKLIPKNIGFTDIPKKGGKFPSLAKKIGYDKFGLFMEQVLVKSLQPCGDTTIVESFEYFKKIQPDLSKYLNFADYKDPIRLAREHFGYPAIGLVHEPEWTCGKVQGHPDIVSGDCIYDIKTTGQFGAMRIDTIYQLLSYFCLGRELYPGRYTKIGLILPAQGIIDVVDLSQWDHVPFWERLQNCVILKKQRESAYDVNPYTLLTFEMVRKNYCGGTVQKKDFYTAIEYGLPLQFFIRGRQDANVVVSPAERKKLKNTITRTKSHIYIHSPYTLSPSCRDSLEEDSGNIPWISQRIGYLLELGSECGMKGIVIHCGSLGAKKKKRTPLQALLNMFSTVIEAANYATESCPLLIETCAARKGELLADVSELASFWMALPMKTQKVVKICLDTCHVFSAGYDPEEFMVNILEAGVPIGLIHYNDSYLPKNAHRDRHAPIGYGFIGIDPLAKVLGRAVVEKIDCVYE